jgi:hypothetical protein
MDNKEAIMDKNLAEWFASYDTGISSTSIALFLSAGVKYGAPPSDGSDFGRCYRLLNHMGWRHRIIEMQDHGPIWAEYAERWGEIEAAYLAEIEKRGGRCYPLMKRIEADAYERARYNVTRDKDGGLSSYTRGDEHMFSLGNGLTVKF